VDPTVNVLGHVQAAVQRQDDLREAESKFLASALKHHKQVAELRATHAREFGLLKSEHAKELRDAETARVNAIRQVDVQQRDTQAQTAAAAITALASNVSTVAETLRTAAAQMATNLAEQAAQQNEAINRRLVALEQASYEGRGKQQVADPQIAGLIEEMKRVTAAQVANAGRSAGGQALWGYIVGAAGLGALLWRVLSGN